MKYIFLTHARFDFEILVFPAHITYLKPLTVAKHNYTEIHFDSGTKVEVKETVSQIETKITDPSV